MKLIDVNIELPIPKKKVRLFRYIPVDCGNAFIWETTGWLVYGNVFSVKWNEAINKHNSQPTHWAPIANNENKG